jgi:hypothetical protein
MCMEIRGVKSSSSTRTITTCGVFKKSSVFLQLLALVVGETRPAAIDEGSPCGCQKVPSIAVVPEVATPDSDYVQEQMQVSEADTYRF